MTQNTTRKTSRDLRGPEPRKDSERETREAIIADADKTDDGDRDLVHGDGEHNRHADEARRSLADE